MKRSRTFLLTALLLALGLLAGCAGSTNATGVDVTEVPPLASSLAWGMTAEEAAKALGIDLEQAQADGTAAVDAQGMCLSVSLPGPLGTEVPARVYIAAGAEMLHRIEYDYAASELDALLAALNERYGEAVVDSYLAEDGTLYDTSDNPRNYPVGAQPHSYLWPSEKTLEDYPQVIDFFQDTQQTGYDIPLLYDAKAGESLVATRLVLDEAQGTVTFLQDARLLANVLIYDGYMEAKGQAGSFAAYYQERLDAWSQTYGLSAS